MDSLDNALAETINGLYKTEVIKHKGPWRSVKQVEFATAEWVDWSTIEALRVIGVSRQQNWRPLIRFKPSPTIR